MNVNISKSEYTEHWHKTVVCDRCKRIIASAQCNKKPREDEVQKGKMLKIASIYDMACQRIAKIH